MKDEKLKDEAETLKSEIILFWEIHSFIAGYKSCTVVKLQKRGNTTAIAL